MDGIVGKEGEVQLVKPKVALTRQLVSMKLTVVNEAFEYFRTTEGRMKRPMKINDLNE